MIEHILEDHPKLRVDPTPLLPVFEAATFVEPRLLELSEDRVTPPPNPPCRADEQVGGPRVDEW